MGSLRAPRFFYEAPRNQYAMYRYLGETIIPNPRYVHTGTRDRGLWIADIVDK